MSLDPYKLRNDFPILSQTMPNGKPLVYLDNGATSQKPLSVIQATNDYYTKENANIHRGVYYLSQHATELFERTRIKTSHFFQAQCAKAIIFTRGTTDAINLVAQTYGRVNVSEGDEIVLSVQEHHSNLVPWQMLAREKKAFLKFIPILADTTYDLSKLSEIITKRTKIVAISQMSNVTGTVHDLRKIIDRARQVGAKVLVDGAQAACHMPIHLVDLDVDFYAFSAHKMLGPTGVGVLFGKEEILEAMPPWLGGGDMIESVELESSTYAALPAKLEAGTPNIAGVIGFSHALDYLQKVGMQNIKEHERMLTEYALERFHKIGGLTLYGTEDLENRGGVISFTLDGIHPHDVGSILDEEGVAIRVGHHCCQPLMKQFQIPGTCRASFYFYNTKEDIDVLIKSIEKVKSIFGRVVRK
ncbi:cysteine desulfurase [Leptospira levettii]|uniref:cysteine desulfurase n=2 Tax=Leptospira levettii TaxID=2023178 RepID=UPI000C29725D|nr:cysteine desulfurase [Leptospira levettii]MCG6149116.1 cysteine desulfurase [Leptospira levettii]MCW7472164.1 cysteine desulfurase [Leptospira levettii]MCW7509155.1 cysteine desulfurase [Leptospira levettii]MCW7520244.1 cysteine desulfurase [Leptospira levettii]PJZ35686.1 cysteine desulfurase [Leptospira levettii]